MFFARWYFHGVAGVKKKVELHHPHRPNDDPNLRHLIASVCLTRWWFQIFFIFTPKFGEDSHFDEHIFQMGWFNHQPVKQVKCCLNWNAAGSRKILPNKNRGVSRGQEWHMSLCQTWIPKKTCQQDTMIMIIDTVDGSEIRLTCWYGSFIPLFTGFCTSQVVVWDFFHDNW